jgi:type I protein arginine methyltransferase
MYSIPSYVKMITDGVRVDAYAKAMRRVITPDSFVLEIGTGVGVFAVMASQLGARRVVAIEPSDAIAVARLLAKDNGATAVEFIQALSQDVTLSERPDVIVSDLRGMLPVYDGHLKSIMDARDRLLAPGGVLIPLADTLYAAVVQLPQLDACRAPWRARVGNVKLDVLRRFVINTWDRVRFEPRHVLSAPQPWATIDYRVIGVPHVTGAARLVVNRASIGHGLAVWFDATLLEGITFSNAPDGPELVYGTAFFPWPDPVELGVGDEIDVRIDARHVGDDYLWRWDSKVVDPSHAVPPKAEFHQSTFEAAPFVPAKLARGSAARVPVLSDDGQIERFILDSMNGAMANGEIARTLMDRFPARFARLNDALGRVGTVARRFALD